MRQKRIIDPKLSVSYALKMFEITGDDIARLNDVDLRALVARLCEAEMRRRDLPSVAVTWGGSQTAADAGLDVRVTLSVGTAIGGFVPRPATGFQVKKPDMPRNAILAEMRPSGAARPVIQELAALEGAYIIVSSAASTSGLALSNRRQAMAEAVSDVPGRERLTLDFYDRTRLSTWLRDHEGLIPWVRDRIGRTILGWRSYGAWTYAPNGSDDVYLLDDQVRVQTGKKDDGGGRSALAGIECIRDLLRAPGAVVRVVGLSGVGKTRFVQALFDARVGKRSLDPSLAAYTDMADAPDPPATGLATNFIAQRTRAILVIDNCPPDLHRRLSELCRGADSTVSVITVEYDIRDDEPEGTEVFALEPASTGLVEKLTMQRFPGLSAVDAGTAAEFSGGNARIALALAATVGRNETLAGLTDEDLFRRLFEQRHEHDEALLLVAQACALVYSFQGEDLVGAQAELVLIGGLVGKSAQELFRGVAELRRRNLVQQRNVWRAVLPHAIANRLAAMALQNIPWAVVETHLVNGAPARLFQSFSRRLGYLHDSAEARTIVERWLSADGLVGNPLSLNELGRVVFGNIAPVAPDAALIALERGLRGTDGGPHVPGVAHFVRTLRALAYEAELFDRAAASLVMLAVAEDDDSKHKEARDAFVSLFFIYLSGTHASVEQRLRMIERLARSDSAPRQALGLQALGAVLETRRFTSFYSFEFGARSRDHGYRPQTTADVSHWYASALKLAETLACSEEPIAVQVRSIIAENFRGLWTMAGMFDDLERIGDAILARHFWREGWIAAHQTLRFDAQKLQPEIADRLTALERRLRPTGLIDRVRAIVLTTKATSLDLDDFDDDDGDAPAAGLHLGDRAARKLGEDLARDEASLLALLPELVTGEGGLWSLGRGLADGAAELGATWDCLVAQMAAVPESKQNVQVLRGILFAVADKDVAVADALLEKSLDHEALARWYPALQSAVQIDGRGMERLRRSLAGGAAAIRQFGFLAFGRATAPVAPADLKAFILSIAEKPGGFDVALEILSARLDSDRHDKVDHAPALVDAGRELMAHLAFGDRNDRDDYKLRQIARTCLVGQEDAAIVKDIIRNLKDAISTRGTQASYHDDFLKGLLAAQPVAVLNALFGDEKERELGVLIVESLSQHHKNPLDAVPEQVLLQWCDGEADIRYPTAAGAITVFHRPTEKTPLQWTSAARQLLKNGPDRVQILKQFVRRFRPMSWSGSRATIMENNAKLLDELDSDPDPAVAAFVVEEKERLRQDIEIEKRWEAKRDREKDERFE